MRIAIITDAWRPQVNGVVTTLGRTRDELEARGHRVTVVNHSAGRTMPCPSYPEIRLAVLPGRRVARELDAAAPDAVHIATEGPLGMAARSYCLKHGLSFTTSYHTQFPRYLRQRAPVPESWSYAWLRRFHGRAVRTLVPTEQQRRDLVDHGFDNVVIWSRGVDTDLFRPLDREFLDLPRPICIWDAGCGLPRDGSDRRRPPWGQRLASRESRACRRARADALARALPSCGARAHLGQGDGRVHVASRARRRLRSPVRRGFGNMTATTL